MNLVEAQKMCLLLLLLLRVQPCLLNAIIFFILIPPDTISQKKLFYIKVLNKCINKKNI